LGQCDWELVDVTSCSGGQESSDRSSSWHSGGDILVTIVPFAVGLFCDVNDGLAAVATVVLLNNLLLSLLLCFIPSGAVVLVI
jgi:hypothetical protein